MDHPTMGIMNNDQPTVLVQSWYKFLEQEGVLYSDGDLLAYGLNHMDIEKWWSELVSTNGYREFKRKFTRKTELKKFDMQQMFGRGGKVQEIPETCKAKYIKIITKRLPF
jgi:hypothetical protein